MRSGARLILNYNPAQQAFVGTVQNTTSNVLGQVRIEVHLSNGVELGPTTPVDLQAGQAIPIELPSTTGSFTGWIAHAEVGSGGEGGQAGGEARGEGSSREGAGGEGHGAGGEGGSEGGAASAEAAREAAMSSPITPLDQPWTGVLGGIAVDARYDAATQTIHTTVRNALGQQQCYVQVEPHLKAGTRTVGELGPGQVGDLNPGQQGTSSLGLASEPTLAGVAFDGYVIHVEVFDCGGPGPVPHSGGEGGEGSGGEGAGGEGHGPGGEGGSEGAGAEGFGCQRSCGQRRGQRREPGAGRDLRRGARWGAADPELRRGEQRLHGHGGEHDRRHPAAGADRGASVERGGVGADDAGGHAAGPGAGGGAAGDGGAVHGLDGPRRSRQWRRGRRRARQRQPGR